MSKKAKTVAIVLTMAVVLLQSAWAGGRAQPAPSGQTVDRSNFNALGTFPLVKNKETLNILTAMDIGNFNGDTNLFTKYYEEKTNVHVNWNVVSLDQFKERVNLALASAEPIDFIAAANSSMISFTMTDYLKYAEQKVIIPVNPWIESDSIYLKEKLNEVPMWKEFLTQPDGNIYIYPTLNDCYHCKYYGKMWVNKEFLKNLNLKVPTTTEEFRQMLIAFKTRDANGNGDPNDEIPLMGAVHDFMTNIDTFLMSAFVYDDGKDRLYVDNGKVVAAYMQPEFQEGLRYLNGLFREGLVEKDTFTVNRNVRHQLNSGKYESIIGAMPNHHAGNLGVRESNQPVRSIDYEPIPPLKGPKGLQVTRYDYYTQFMYTENGSMIPATSKNPALVVRFLDWFYTVEGNTLMRSGPKGIAWTDADPGATGPDGSPALRKPIIMNPGDANYGNTGWVARFPNFTDSAYRNMDQTAADMYAPDGSGGERFLEVKSRENYAPYGLDISKLVPPMFYTASNALEMSTLQTNINTYVEESIAKFVVGDLNVETDWARFQNELRNLGIDRYLQIIQSTYDKSALKR
jgi:putative aldouronate transport system substrate-binding protein